MSPTRWSRALTVLAIVMLVPRAVSAESPWAGIADPIFQHLAPDLDTPDSVVLAITQDQQGFLWIATEQGLLRWDGYRYRHYRADRNDPAALPDNFVQALHVDAAGRLWVGTLSGGLSRYDRETDRFSNYRSETHSLSSNAVRKITSDSDGGVWVATNHGIDEVSAERGVVRELHHIDADASSLPDDNVRAVMRDRHGRVWVGTRGGPAYLDSSGHALVTLDSPMLTGKKLDVVGFGEDHEGRIWVGSRAGAYALVPSEGTGRFDVRPIEGSESYSVISLIEGRPGEMWLGTYGDGIVVADTANLKITTHIHHDPLLPKSLSDDTLWDLHRDDTGDIWVATNRGVSSFDPNQRAIMTLFGVTSRKQGLSDNDVEAVLPLPDGRLWLGLGSSGVNVLDPAAGRVAEYHQGRDVKGKLQTLGEVGSLALGDNGEIFLAARAGLYRKAERDPEPTQIPLPSGMGLRAIAVSGETLWLGTYDDGVWSTSTLHPGVKVRPYVRADQLTDPRISTILADTVNSLWVGTFNGLNHLDLVTGEIEHVEAKPGSPGAITAPYVSTLLMDRKGRLWVGAQSGGISILEGHGSARQVHHVGTADGLPNLSVDKLLESSTGDIWAATDSGLAIIDATSFKVRSLGRAEGVVVSTYWTDSGATATDGTLLFGGTDGMTLVQPQYLESHHHRPRVAVDETHLGGQEVPWGRSTGGSAGTALLIQPDANSFSVEFSALDFSAPERNRYSYRLEGYDASWIETDWKHRTAAYTNLPPGSYVLKLRASNRDGEWTEEPVSLPIEVQPSWYQTLWFKIAGAVLGIGAIRLLIGVRTRQLRRRQLELEQQVLVQTAQLRERERQLERLAYLDPLTGLANRRMLTETFERLSVHLSGAKELVLLLIDLDRFKQINDTLGHDAGDALLVETSRRLGAAVRTTDHVFRLGGDEFAILLIEPPDRAAVEVVCERIIAGVHVPIAFNGVEMITSPSIGIARCPPDGRSLGSLLKIADLALYEAKRHGRKTWRWGGARTERRPGESQVA
jgi:diguanylate cyclase (GGDEF)-like protein